MVDVKQKAKKQISEIILTDEQKVKLEQYAKQGIEIGLACQTEPVTEKEKMVIFDLINNHRQVMGLKPAEKFEWFDSPYAAKKAYPVLTYENACLGQHDISWLQYYWFYREELGYTVETEEIRYLYELSKRCGWFWVSDDQLPHRNVIIATSRPMAISWQKKANGEQIVSDMDQMAIRFRDGTGVYVLNGTYIDSDHEWIITTPRDQLKLKDVLSIRNTELRSQALRKIDMEKCFQEFKGKKLIDEANDYRLWQLDFITSNRTYLEMVCPSSSKVAIEAVPPDCETVDSALIWRETGKLTINVLYKAPKIRT